MKKMMVTFMVFSLFTAILFNGSFAGTTIEHLKAAYKFERTCSFKYNAYATQAKKENLGQIAVLFTAIAKSQAIHAANHKAVIEKMGQDVEDFEPEYIVNTTRENLASASKEELNQINDFYTPALAVAKDDKAMDAAKSIRWAMETEKKHLPMFQNALDALNSNKTATLPSVYFVCPKCGNTYDVPKPQDECSFCGTKSTKFIRFAK